MKEEDESKRTMLVQSNGESISFDNHSNCTAPKTETDIVLPIKLNPTRKFYKYLILMLILALMFLFNVLSVAITGDLSYVFASPHRQKSAFIVSVFFVVFCFPAILLTMINRHGNITINNDNISLINLTGIKRRIKYSDMRIVDRGLGLVIFDSSKTAGRSSIYSFLYNAFTGIAISFTLLNEPYNATTIKSFITSKVNDIVRNN